MKLAILAIALLFSISAFAQSKEYIVKSNGDTVRGEVKILTKHVKVITALADTVVFNSKDVRLYVKNNTARVVLRLVLYGYTDNIEEAQGSAYRDPVYDTTILLTPIISGKALNLFTAKDKRRVDYFFVQGPGDIEPVQMLYYVGGDIREREEWNRPYSYVSFVSPHRLFIDQLRETVAECKYMTEGDLQVLEYRLSSFKSYVKRYNKNCR